MAAVANEDGKGVKIDISDNGTGIAPADRERIFEPFFSSRQDGQGAGLGLAIVSGVMRDHSGSINFETEWGRGNHYDVSPPGSGDAPVT